MLDLLTQVCSLHDGVRNPIDFWNVIFSRSFLVTLFQHFLFPSWGLNCTEFRNVSWMLTQKSLDESELFGGTFKCLLCAHCYVAVQQHKKSPIASLKTVGISLWPSLGQTTTCFPASRQKKCVVTKYTLVALSYCEDEGTNNVSEVKNKKNLYCTGRRYN